MPTLKIPLDFEGVEDYDAIDSGVYPAVIEKLVYTGETVKDNGDPKSANIRVEYTITDPDYEGRKLSQWLYFSPKAIFRMKEFFDVFGLDYREIDVDEETGVVTDPDLSGEAVEIKVKKQPKWNDPDRDDNKIDTAPVRIGKSSRRAKPKDDEDAEDEAPRRSSRGSEDSPRGRGRSIR